MQTSAIPCPRSADHSTPLRYRDFEGEWTTTPDQCFRCRDGEALCVCCKKLAVVVIDGEPLCAAHAVDGDGE